MNGKNQMEMFRILLFSLHKTMQPGFEMKHRLNKFYKRDRAAVLSTAAL